MLSIVVGFLQISVSNWRIILKNLFIMVYISKYYTWFCRMKLKEHRKSNYFKATIKETKDKISLLIPAFLPKHLEIKSSKEANNMTQFNYRIIESLSH